MNPVTIAALSENEIAAINAFLQGEHRTVFSDEQITTLRNAQASTEGCFERGFFADLSSNSALGKSQTGLTAEDAKEIFSAHFEEAGLDREFFDEMLEQQMVDFSLDQTAHAIILASQNAEYEVLFLNKYFGPIFISQLI